MSRQLRLGGLRRYPVTRWPGSAWSARRGGGKSLNEGVERVGDVMADDAVRLPRPH